MRLIKLLLPEPFTPRVADVIVSNQYADQDAYHCFYFLSAD